MLKLRILGALSFGALGAGALVGCQTVQSYHDKVDERVIKRQSVHTESVVERFIARADALPDVEQPREIKVDADLPPASSDTLLLRPAYAENLVALDEDSIAELRRFAGQFTNGRGLTIDITGHASSQQLSPSAAAAFGSNEGLAQARAEAVADVLRTLLPAGSNVLIHTSGDREPLTSATPAAAENRRVHVAARYEPPSALPVVVSDQPVPSDFTPWWQSQVVQILDPARSTAQEETVETLYMKALEHSSQIRVFRSIPVIRETAVTEAEGAYDLRAFAEAHYRNTNEPVGSTLTTGGASRFSERDSQITGGLRQRIATGGELELSQRVGTLDNNSVFFIPEEQATSRLAMRFTQPLLNGGGVEYNRSTVAIAKLDGRIALDEFQRQFETHLLEISRAYWSLYRERALLLQRQKLAQAGAELVAELRSRRELDTLESQVTRAEAELAARQAATVRAELAVRNAQSRIGALVNDPSFFTARNLEVIPTSVPVQTPTEISMSDAVLRAIRHRPEVRQAIKQVHAGAIRADMSKNEVLPVLNLILESRVDGLDDDYSVGGALHRQFAERRPSVGVGLQFEMPLQNRKARARRTRRVVELRQLTDQLETTLETIGLEVKVAVREVSTAQRELTSYYYTMRAAERELATLEARRDVDTGLGRWTSGYLNELIDSQRRLGQAEESYAGAVAVYNVALRNLDRATGVLLESQGIDPKPAPRPQI